MPGKDSGCASDPWDVPEPVIRVLINGAPVRFRHVDNLEGRIVATHIRGERCEHVEYEVAYWSGTARVTVTVTELEIEVVMDVKRTIGFKV